MNKRMIVLIALVVAVFAVPASAETLEVRGTIAELDANNDTIAHSAGAPLCVANAFNGLPGLQWDCSSFAGFWYDQCLDFMLEHIGFDYTTNEIAEYADVAQGAIKRDFQRLVDCGMVTKTRKIGGAQLYTLSNDDAITAALIEFDDKLATIMSEKITGYPEPEEKLTIPDDQDEEVDISYGH